MIFSNKNINCSTENGETIRYGFIYYNDQKIRKNPETGEEEKVKLADWIHDEIFARGIDLTYLQWQHDMKKECESLLEKINDFTNSEQKIDNLIDMLIESVEAIYSSDLNLLRYNEKDLILNKLHTLKNSPEKQSKEITQETLNKIKTIKQEIAYKLENNDYGEYEAEDSKMLFPESGWEINEEGKYEINKKANFAAETMESGICVLWSQHTDNCSLCSPCAPNGGNLASPGEYKTFDLPPDWYEQIE